MHVNWSREETKRVIQSLLSFMDKLEGENDQIPKSIWFHCIFHGFSERLDHLTWLDGHTRSAIRQKVGRTSELFGYPDFIFNSSELDRVYGDLQVTEDEYLENQVEIGSQWMI